MQVKATTAELSLEQLDRVAGGRGDQPAGWEAGKALAQAAVDAFNWLGAQFDKYKDKRGDSFEHWG